MYKEKQLLRCWLQYFYLHLHRIKERCTATYLYSNRKDIHIQINTRTNMAKSGFCVVRETQVNTPESLLTVNSGDTVEVSCKDFSPYSTVKSAATRLNKRLKKKEFKISTPDNGATIVIKRLK